MYFRTLLLVALSLFLSFTASIGKALDERAPNVDYKAVCKAISKSISRASRVYYHADPEFSSDISAWSTTNVESAACIVEPAVSKDVAMILKIVGAKKAQFAVKSGGHSPNPGFSSTKGVLIVMRRFSNVKYDSSSKTAEIGPGLIWDEVYAALGQYHVSVLGARASGVGVGGFLLGGGYSFKTNQYGLAIDTIVSYTLVTPDGEIIMVTEKSHPDLFFGLKGGLNNFGVVTKFTLKTFPQTAVWGGVITYDQSALPALKSAFSTFISRVKDPKASVITSFNAVQGKLILVQTIFYDAPTPPKGIFDSFLGIKSLTKDVSQRSLVSMIRSVPSNITEGKRNSFATLPIQQYTPAVINAIVNEATFWGKELLQKSAIVISYTMEPFVPGILGHNTTATAYPPGRSIAMSPFMINYAWASPAYDNVFYAASKKSYATLQKVVQKEGLSVAHGASVYPNYAPPGTPLNDMYGENVAKLKALKKKVDPDNVMGLTGGFKL